MLKKALTCSSANPYRSGKGADLSMNTGDLQASGSRLQAPGFGLQALGLNSLSHRDHDLTRRIR